MMMVQEAVSFILGTSELGKIVQEGGNPLPKLGIPMRRAVLWCGHRGRFEKALVHLSLLVIQLPFLLCNQAQLTAHFLVVRFQLSSLLEVVLGGICLA
jgi:hypothetical protein